MAGTSIRRRGRLPGDNSNAGVLAPIVEIRTLGQVQVLIDGRPTELGSPMVTGLLALLAQSPTAAIERSTLIDQLWNEAPPRTANAAFRTRLAELRQALEATGRAVTVDAVPPRHLRLIAEHVDHVRFDALGQRARTAIASGDTARARTLLERALALWNGTPFDGIDLPALDLTRGRLEQSRENTLLQVWDIDVSSGDHAAVLPDLMASFRDRPDDERRANLAMRALFFSGMQTDALDVFRTARDAAAEHGLDVSADLRALEGRIIRREERAESGPEPTRVGRIPPALAADQAGELVGRKDELEHIRQQLQQGLRGHGSSTLITGEGGAGKSELLRAAALLNEEMGGATFFGWAASDAPRAFELFTNLEESFPDAGRGSRLAIAAAELGTDRRSRMLGELQHELALLTEHAPVVLVLLDDLHWSDTPSMWVLERLIRRRVPGLVIMASTRLSGGTGVDQFLGRTTAIGTLEELPVSPLNPVDVQRMMIDRLHAPIRHRTRIAENIVRRTGGNAFLVNQIVGELGSVEGPIDDRVLDLVPDSIASRADAVLASFSPDEKRAVEALAVGGRNTPLEQLAAVTGDDPDHLADLLSGPALSEIVLEADRADESFRFRHDLLRDGVYSCAPGRRQRRLHARFAELTYPPGAPDRAFHLVAAAPLVSGDAVDVEILGSARTLLAEHQFSEARRLCDEALATRKGSSDPVAAEMVLLRGRANQLMGYRSEALDDFDHLVDLSSGSDIDHLLGECGREIAIWGTGVLRATGGRSFSLLDRILRVLRTSEAEEAAQLELIVANVKALASGPSPELFAEAERLRSEVTVTDLPLADLLDMYLGCGDPDHQARITRCEAAVRAAETVPGTHPLVWVDGVFFHVAALLTSTDPKDRSAALALRKQLASVIAPGWSPTHTWLVQVTEVVLAQEHGDLTRWATLADAALEFGQDHELPDAAASYAGHTFVTLFLTGRTHEALPSLLEQQEALPEVIAFHALLAVALGRAGDTEQAQAAVVTTLDWVEANPVHQLAGGALMLAAQAVAEQNLTHLATQASTLLKPWSGSTPRLAQVGAGLGPADRLLGCLAALAGDSASAEAWLRSAIEQADELSARPWSAIARWDLSKRVEPVDASALLTEARSIALDVGINLDSISV